MQGLSGQDNRWKDPKSQALGHKLWVHGFELKSLSAHGLRGAQGKRLGVRDGHKTINSLNYGRTPH
jgi:hypothetical protein